MEHCVGSLLHLVFFPEERKLVWCRNFYNRISGTGGLECNVTEASPCQPWCHISGKSQTGKGYPPTWHHKTNIGGMKLSSPDRASMGCAVECRVVSSKVTLVPSDVPSQLMETWLQSSASSRGRLFEWPLMSISPSKLHWLDLPFRPETKPSLLESAFSLNSDPSTWRSSGSGLEWKHSQRERERDDRYT